MIPRLGVAHPVVRPNDLYIYIFFLKHLLFAGSARCFGLYFYFYIQIYTSTIISSKFMDELFIQSSLD